MKSQERGGAICKEVPANGAGSWRVEGVGFSGLERILPLNMREEEEGRGVDR